jgi:hypothetical protein
MADLTQVDNAGTPYNVITDEVTDGTIGTGKVQFVKLMDGTLNGTTKATVGSNGLHVDVRIVPADPFGANADAVVAAGAAGSIQAKLRRLTTDLDSIKTAIDNINTSIYTEGATDATITGTPIL